MLTEDFLEMPRGAMVMYDNEVKTYIAATNQGIRYFDKDFVADNPGLFKSIDEDIVDFELEPVNRVMTSETPNTDTIRGDEQAKDYMGQLARALSVENLKQETKEQKETMQTNETILNRLEEVKAAIIVLESMPRELEDETITMDELDTRIATQETLNSLRAQYYTLNWVLNQ